MVNSCTNKSAGGGFERRAHARHVHLAERRDGERRANSSAVPNRFDMPDTSVKRDGILSAELPATQRPSRRPFAGIGTGTGCGSDKRPNQRFTRVKMTFTIISETLARCP